MTVGDAGFGDIPLLDLHLHRSSLWLLPFALALSHWVSWPFLDLGNSLFVLIAWNTNIGHLTCHLVFVPLPLS
jgi:hypothetical protein